MLPNNVFVCIHYTTSAIIHIYNTKSKVNSDQFSSQPSLFSFLTAPRKDKEYRSRGGYYDEVYMHATVSTHA